MIREYVLLLTSREERFTLSASNLSDYRKPYCIKGSRETRLPLMQYGTGTNYYTNYNSVLNDWFMIVMFINLGKPGQI